MSPLNKTGKKILKNMQKQYGKVKGKGVFYASIKKHPRKTKRWEKFQKLSSGS